MTEDKSSIGGTDVDSTKVEECMDECRDLEGCVGFDWSTTGNGPYCWLHDDQDLFDDSKDTDNVDQYKRNDCEGINNVPERNSQKISCYNNVY